MTQVLPPLPPLPSPPTFPWRMRTPSPVARGAVHLGGPAPAARTLVDVLAATAARTPGAAAVDDGSETLDYRTLLARVTAVAGQLVGHGVGRGDRVGIHLSSGTAGLYVAILGVLSVGAAYVPVDLDDPPERAALVWREAGVCAVLTDPGASGATGRNSGAGGATVTVGPGTARSRGAGPGRPTPADDAWMIFTSGSTGTPKGVVVTHRSAAAFVDAEAGLFLRDRPLGPADRVLAGLSVAFDASCEEMWLAWRHGACLVPAPRTLVRSGAELGDWFDARGITVVSTVPTLAGLWTPEQLAGVRLLILGGEACPEHLAHRLAAACDEVWNTYGPTEATVVSSAARLTPHDPVRIGTPLAGWDLAVVDPASGQPVEEGEIGELVIAGVGTARYADPERDAARFPPLPALRWRRAYRSGDLVRADPRGLSYVGRADSQIKIRGYRVELSEIEAALLDAPGVAQAVVGTHRPSAALTELVGYYSTAEGASVDPDDLADRLRARLPAHMVPAYLEELAVIPTTTSGKADRAHLPAPSSRRGSRAAQRSGADPATGAERVLARVLAGHLDLDRVPVDADVFDDLGASSLIMAHVCAEARAELGPIAMRAVYEHRTVRGLAAALADRADRGGTVPPVDDHAPTPAGPPVSDLTHRACGAAQLLVLLALVGLASTAVGLAVTWVEAATTGAATVTRAVAASDLVVVGWCVLPVVAKWALVGRFRPGAIPLWGPAYLRFWTVATLLRTSPLATFAGSPLLGLYLRALGARVGRGAVIFSRTVPVCTDLVSIGAGTVVRPRCALTGYRAERGALRLGTVDVGAGVVLGESSVVDVDTVVGDRAQLGHASSLHPGQTIPADARWHGSPARPVDDPAVDFRAVGPARCSPARRAVFGAVQLVNLLVVAPVALGLVALLAERLPTLDAWVAPGAGALETGLYWLHEVLISLGLFGATLLGGLAVVVVVPRLVRSFVRPDRVYPLYGPAWWCHRVIARVSAAPFLVRLFGDSSYVVGYLRAIGYRISPTGQTGSNVGADLTHETPFLAEVGAGTMLSDGVGLITADVTHCAFRTGTVAVGAHSFLGNAISVPTGARLGDRCFVGTKTMVPVDGVARHDVGLLGSPAFEIPRTRHTDPRFDLSRREFKIRLAAKNRHNLRTIGLFLLTQWLRMHLAVIIGLGVVNLYAVVGTPVVALGAVLAAVVDVAYTAVLERAVTGLRALRPRYCSIYDPYFWWHERFWKLSTQPTVLNGTPWKGLVWRLLGVRVGRRLFDDGAAISEKSLVTLGDDVVLGAGAILQSHSMEDGVFKSDHIVLGDAVTVGPGAFVHYGTTLGDGAALATDAFLMKGETVPAGSRWCGNPAQEVAGSAVSPERLAA